MKKSFMPYVALVNQVQQKNGMMKDIRVIEEITDQSEIEITSLICKEIDNSLYCEQAEYAGNAPVAIAQRIVYTGHAVRVITRYKVTPPLIVFEWLNNNQAVKEYKALLFREKHKEGRIEMEEKDYPRGTDGSSRSKKRRKVGTSQNKSPEANTASSKESNNAPKLSVIPHTETDWVLYALRCLVPNFEEETDKEKKRVAAKTISDKAWKVRGLVRPDAVDAQRIFKELGMDFPNLEKGKVYGFLRNVIISLEVIIKLNK